MSTRLIVMVASFLAAVPLEAVAQSAGPKLNDVFVRSTDGVEVRGQLIELQHGSLSLFVEGTRRDIPLASVDRIQTRGDGVLNGALIGVAIGAGLWGLFVGEYGAQAVPSLVTATIGYGLIGVGVDAMIPGRTTIYSKQPSDAIRARDKRAGLAFKIAF